MNAMPIDTQVRGSFVDDAGETWYRIDHLERMAPFFVALASDSDVWAYVSTAGSIAAGRRDPQGAFFPYETVDRIHLRGEHTGPRTWLRVHDGRGGAALWQPFASGSHGVSPPQRSAWKNLAGTRLRLREIHPDGALAFECEWSSAASLGLVRRARLWALQGRHRVEVLDGLLNLIPPGVSVIHAATMSVLTDAYKWNELAAGGRLGLFTLAAQIWDRAEPKESFEALAAWHAGAPAGAVTLLSDRQVAAFCAGQPVTEERRTRGRRGAFLLRFDADLDADAGAAGQTWHQVIDGPLSQVQAFELARRIEGGTMTSAQVEALVAANTADLDALFAGADAVQHSADPMAAAHHRSNVLFNGMRGGVFVDGARMDREALGRHLRQRHRSLAAALAPMLAALPEKVDRNVAISAARAAGDAQAERLMLEHLPLTFSRRHGDPSRPWNRFSIRVRDAQGQRLLHHEGNWRDIFQNWEALLPSEPAWVGSMIAVFLGAMTVDGHNPYRIGSDGIDWEVPEPENPWASIGYWGDHQVVYLLRLLQAAAVHDPALLPSWWDRALFSFADVPYRLRPHAQQIARPKDTIVFDEAAHARALERVARIGADGRLLCDAQDRPVLATLGEKLATVVLAKLGTLVPGGGLWLNTQRPEWNDANNALVGNGLSVVTLAPLRALLDFIAQLPGANEPFDLSAATLQALQAMDALLADTPLDAVDDELRRRTFVDAAGAILERWRDAGYRGAEGRAIVRAPQGLLTGFARRGQPLIDATLARCRRPDGLMHSYNLVDFTAPTRARVDALGLMLEGQVSMLADGALTPAASVALLQALFASPLFDERRQSFLLYPDRELPGFLERNRLDAAALATPEVQAVLQAGRNDLLQRQSDGTVRFAPSLHNGGDVAEAAHDLDADARDALVRTYERVLDHHAFTGRSGTMFAYEGLGCIYWHMIGKLLLAVQERVFDAVDAGAPEAAALAGFYRRVRDGLGYRRGPAAYGAFPMDPYSHTPAEGGAQQPGMTGQVKEEILTRWGELGVRLSPGRVRFDPVLLDRREIPAGGALRFTLAGVPWSVRLGDAKRLRVLRDGRWIDCEDAAFEMGSAEAVEAWVTAEPATHRAD